MSRSSGPTVISLDEFFEVIEDSSVPIEWDTPSFTLILGAGASRSAGIPTANEMTALMAQIIGANGYPLEDLGPEGLTFSRAISTIAEYADEGLIRKFILRCVRRGSREPNVTHLVAANLACCGFFKKIVTTNFDDLALAAFWQLPFNEIYREPYVVYDPLTVHLSRVELGEEVPIIIKAHGHHTQYGLGLLEHHLADFAPGVKRAMRWQSPPKLGYMVVGSSGMFPDGVIAALKDKRRITHGLPIYWFFRDKFAEPNPTSPLGQLTRLSDVRFVRCDDSDVLFLRLWHALDGAADVLDADDLFTPATVSEQIDTNDGAPEPPWAFDRSASVEGSREQQRTALGITALRRSVLPLLDAIDKWDNELLSYDCVPELREHHVHAPQVYWDGRDAKEVEGLGKAVTRRLPWTRRNRQLLRLALDESTEPVVSHTLLTTIDTIRALRQPKQTRQIKKTSDRDVS